MRPLLLSILGSATIALAWCGGLDCTAVQLLASVHIDGPTVHTQLACKSCIFPTRSRTGHPGNPNSCLEQRSHPQSQSQIAHRMTAPQVAHVSTDTDTDMDGTVIDLSPERGPGPSGGWQVSVIRVDAHLWRRREL